MLYSIDLIKAALLGIVEGLTEFLPVSSTAHLLLSSHLIDFNSIRNSVFEIVIQFGAILAICVIYRKRLWAVIVDLKSKNQQRFAINLFFAFAPAACIGVMIHDFIKVFLFSNLVIAIALIVGGILMIIIDHRPKTSGIQNVDQLLPHSALKIGLFQCLAMIPGVSRSGATIIGGMLLGLDRKTATEFSFFLAIPTITAASFYDLFSNYSELTNGNLEIIFVGLISAFISAIFVIKWFIGFVSKNSFVSFGIYRIILGIVILIFIY